MLCYLQELDDVAGTEDSVCSGKLGRFSEREIRCQDTFLSTSSPQNLASSTRAHDNLNLGRGRKGIRGVRKCGVCVTLLNITLLFCVWLLICVVLGHKLKEGRRRSEVSVGLFGSQN